MEASTLVFVGSVLKNAPVVVFRLRSTFATTWPQQQQLRLG